MTNLENFGVLELNSQEIRETNGGLDLKLTALLVIAAFGIGIQVGKWLKSLF
ncbi:hypothetical protein [Polaribacter sp. Z022]|uniref:hypothetical protein n=1 Tax=Polaribacter sp. Z022 TaxID=2927125 RepID=UPI0020208E1F|nr:hypothetical protein [Polaribacter sp. Z022]MCL7752471.1 hypothetical protein [Polaribacter sp. Z022]